MRTSQLKPRIHLFVCANRRDASSPLGSGCAERGDAVYDELKAEVAARGAVQEVWVTKTHCMGLCPKSGSTVAVYGDRSPKLMTEVSSASELFDHDVVMTQPSLPSAILEEVEQLAALQRKKVLDLARRLNPRLTREDIQNPHDFPELDDPDWHYADGVLTGIASVKSALLALFARHEDHHGQEETQA